MQLISVNVGLPREVEWRGHVVRTSIFKSPVAGRVRVSRLNVAGDFQSDPTVHGGIDKAVYVYPSEHYAYWHEELQGTNLPWGAFGENFTTEGLLEDLVSVGDQLRIGSAEFTVTMPRVPCYKLQIRFGRPDMVKRFNHSQRSGYYLSVNQEGEVAAGDSFEVLARAESSITIADLYTLYTSSEPDLDLLQHASQLRALPESWRSYFRERMEE